MSTKSPELHPEATGKSSHSHSSPFGAEIPPEGGVRFRLWAPAAASVQLAIDGRSGTLPMVNSGGWHELKTDDASAGTLYRFVLPDGTRVPDPASRYQPNDVQGPSQVINPRAYSWQLPGWKGRPWSDAVLYEVHVGTFTPEGTFRAAIHKLDHLAQLGVTAIELMCHGEFAGKRGWGYDSVLIFAPSATYGHPDDLKQFIDAAHARGIMVILDVVYNHFGPEGNYIPLYFPQVCTDRYNTPWGPALNFDGEGSQQTREFIIHNALYWIEEFQMDGLRLDAAHELIDNGPRHILDELAERVHAAAGDRTVHLILEHDSNVAHRLSPFRSSTPRSYTAQWNHDMQHLLRPAFAQESESCQENDRSETEKLGKALTEGFVIAARINNAEDPALHPPPAAVPPIDFVSYIQNHDLVGNRVFGERINTLAPGAVIRAISAIYLLLPQVPMLFMGEEWSASTPFPYFCDFHGELAAAVRTGRHEFLEGLHQVDPAELQRAPDPQSEQTFRSAKLHWDELARDPHRSELEWHRRILEVRRAEIVPLLSRIPPASASFDVLGPEAGIARWRLEGGGQLAVAFNLCHNQLRGITSPAGRTLWQEGPPFSDGQLAPWSVRWAVEPSTEG